MSLKTSPEWYHPDFAPYGFDAWPGGRALNAFNHSCCDPFTGYVHVDDYLEGSEWSPFVPLQLFNLENSTQAPDVYSNVWVWHRHFMVWHWWSFRVPPVRYDIFIIPHPLFVHYWFCALQAASWYNHAASQNRQVVMNNRCGANQSDFVTPEYATFPALLVRYTISVYFIWSAY